MADPLTFEIPENLGGARVDKAISEILGVSRSVARALLDEGVTIDGAPARPGDRVGEGATIVTPGLSPVADLQAEAVDFPILFEDDSVVVVDKPPGITVHPGSGRQHGTLAAGLLHRYPELEGVGDPDRWGLIHRLDRETSGVLIVARTTAAYERLTAELAARRIERLYLALAHNRFPVPTGTIDAPIGRDPSQPTRRAVVATGKPSLTHYEVLEELGGGEVSLLEVRLGTGRTHQIRVHLAAIGLPVVGDSVYGVPDPELKRQFLHAWRLAFPHPVTGEPVEAESPLPGDLQSAFDRLAS